jgi:hypothetical protein
MTASYYDCEVNFGPVARGGLRFCFDPPKDSKLMSGKTTISGWAVHRSQQIKKIVCCSKDGLIAGEAVPGVYRPKVKKNFSAFCNADAAGFELVLESPLPGNYTILAVCTDERELELEIAIISEFSRPKLLFMHIAKTAGTTVNSHFQSQYATQLTAVHVESNRAWHEDSGYAKQLEFVSGHISYPHFASKLDLSCYYKTTLLREPYSHLQSHLAWIKHLSEPSEARKLSLYPEFVGELSAKLWHCDLSLTRDIEWFVNSLHGEELVLLDNCQTRYFVRPERGLWVTQENTLNALEALTSFDNIGLTELTDQFLELVSRDMNFTRPIRQVNRNVSRTYYGLEIEQPEVREILRVLVQHDKQLYEKIKESVL